MAEDLEKKDVSVAVDPSTPPVDSLGQATLLNVSGHKQELQRNFGLISLCGLGITSGNVWIALGGTIVCPSQFRVAALTNLMGRLLRYSTEVFLESFTNSLLFHFSIG